MIVRKEEKTNECTKSRLLNSLFFRLAANNVRDYAIILLDINGNIVSWNSGAEYIKGYKANEVIGKHFSIFYTLNDVKKEKPKMELNIAAKEGRFEDEGWRIRKDGSRFWANVVITALRDENGNLEGFIKIVKDLTERKKMEEALKEERRLFIGGPIVVFKWKAGEVSIPVLYVSPNVQDVFGYKPEDFTTGRITYSDIVHPDDLKRIIKESNFYSQKKVPYFEQDYRIVTARGEYRWVHDFTVIERDSEGRITHYHGYVMDVTERKKMEEALKESEEKFKMLAESSTSAIFIIQQDVIKYANPIVKEIIGYPRKEIEKMKFWEFIYPEDRKIVKERGKRRQKGEEISPSRYEFRVITKDGKIKWIDFAVTNILYEKKPAILCNAYDITERKKAEAEMKRALEQEKQFKLRAAHYFFNPIAIAKGYLSLALEEKDDKEKIMKAIKAIDRIEKVVKNITQRGVITE